MNNLNTGRELFLEFSFKLIISSYLVPKKVWDDDTQTMSLVLGTDGQPLHVMETRVKLPMSSKYRGFVFTSTEPLGIPSRYKYNELKKEKVDMGLNENLRSIRVFENVQYKITRTPYILDGDGRPLFDESGHKRLNFSQQEVVKITGTELQAEFDSWKKEIPPNQEGTLRRREQGRYPIRPTDGHLLTLAETELKIKGKIQPFTMRLLEQKGYTYKDGAIVEI